MNNKLIKILILASIMVVCGFVYHELVPFTDLISVNSESLFMPYSSLVFGIYPDSFLQIFTSSDHSWFILSMFHVILDKYLPEILGLHPQVCITLVAKSLFFLIFYILLFAITNAYCKYSKNKNYYAVVLFCTFIFVCRFLQTSGFQWVLVNDCWFLAYILLPIFAILLYNNFEYYYVTQENPNKRRIIETLLLIFCVSISHEFFRFIFLMALFIGFWANYFLLNTDKNVNIYKYLKIYDVLIFLNLITFFTNAYRNWFSSHYHPYSFKELLGYIPEYWLGYRKFVLSDNFWLYLLLFIACILIFLIVKNKEQNKRFLICVSTVLISAFCFMFVIMIGKNDYQFATMVEHYGLRFLLKILLFQLVLSSYGYLINNLENKDKYLKYIICCGTAIMMVLFISGKKVLNFQYTLQWAKELKRSLYIWEKAFLLEQSKTNSDTCRYYSLNENDGFMKSSIKFLIETYDLSSSVKKYVNVSVCDENDSLKMCRRNLQKIIYEETGYIFTKEELTELDFEELQESFEEGKLAE